MAYIIGEKIRKNVLVRFIEKLKYIYEVLEESKGFRFFSTSLLFVYDSKKNDDEEDEIIDLPITDESHERVKLIDFGQTHFDSDSLSPDNDMLNSIDNLLSILQSILGNPSIEPYYSTQD